MHNTYMNYFMYYIIYMIYSMNLYYWTLIKIWPFPTIILCIIFSFIKYADIRKQLE